MMFGFEENSTQCRNNYLMDVLNVAAFIVGMANYGENLSQKAVQKIIDEQTKDIHQHLQEQDEKINKILRILEVK